MKLTAQGASSSLLAGYGVIDSQSKLRRGFAVLFALAALALAFALLSGASAAGVEPQPPGPAKPPPGPKPQLLFFHGGSFLFEDPLFKPSTEQFAREAGFVPHYVIYPLEDMPAAVLAARAAAREMREKVGVEHVFAYGSSAGGTLAALLSGDGLVSAAVAKAPVSDLVGWEWPLGKYGPEYFESVDLGTISRYQLSPDRRPAKSPLLIYQGRSDSVVPPAMNEAFAAKFERVYLWLVPGGHTTERTRPDEIKKSLQWLARTATRQARAAARAAAREAKLP